MTLDPAQRRRVVAWLDTLDREERARAQFYLDMPVEMALAHMGIKLDIAVERMDLHTRDHPTSLTAKQAAATVGSLLALAGATGAAVREFWKGQ